MDASHLTFDGHMDANSSSANDMAHMPLDFDSLMASDSNLSHGLGPFESCIHDDSCLDHHHHFRLPKHNDKLRSNFAQQLQSHASASTIRNHSHMNVGEQHDTTSAAATPHPLSQNQTYSWEHLFNDSALDNPALHAGTFGFCRDDDCASECSSACDGSCPSQCGDTGYGVCCDDDACGSPQLCLDEACRGASHPCTDESCLTETTVGEQPAATAAITDTDKAAAAALASFGETQLQMVQGDFMQSSPAVPPPSRDGPLAYMGLPESIPCGSLSMDSLFTHGPSNFSNQPFQMAFEYALANHIMQYHDPSRGLAHNGTCVANDPGQFISRCTLPKFSPNDNITDPYLSQLQSHECGFPVQDPNVFAHHIFEEHKPALMVHAQQLRFPEESQSRAHADCSASHQHAGCHVSGHMAYGKHFSPSPSPLTNLSIGPSLSTTPSSLATPSPLDPDSGLAELTSIGKPQSPLNGAKPHVLAGEDQFLCRWVTGDGDSICGKRFDDDEQLQKHCKLDHLKQLKKVRGGFRCGWANCTRNTCFTQRSKVERHMQVHTGFKPVQCNICGAALSAKQALDQHMRIHTGETPWVCKYPGCGCAFKQQSALTMHQRTHTGDKPLECEICHKRFSESSNLSKHRRTHNVKGMHECQLCGKDFHRLDQLRRHMGTNHKDRPAEVDALLGKAKTKIQTQKVSKPKKNKGKGKAESEIRNADTLELIKDHLQNVMIGQESS
ncbi:Zinc-responsive transcriptional regulator ZAP1 [Tolypocladium ophioglossoides CBS 100239]|uniref:C2H2 type master regulator of conidiophore development brlA n=1 Tax=Tolypocladium ophioglossoides (strain CBS 100239) TaxID=1163406 RepID=A0A0L0N601_TOLOC|nr:Zinc-responsive transcriptional regulator ZAP1 [Tolypocladium ophioglossoides CBS 100239]